MMMIMIMLMLLRPPPKQLIHVPSFFDIYTWQCSLLAISKKLQTGISIILQKEQEKYDDDNNDNPASVVTETKPTTSCHWEYLLNFLLRAVFIVLAQMAIFVPSALLLQYMESLCKVLPLPSWFFLASFEQPFDLLRCFGGTLECTHRIID